ncbi:MAG: 3-hydroxyacyl-ACP dehydratase FabZ [Thermodesulfobacteriota bacterium]|nr:3-hydroxyacyl-ACP dehydratase FabZ [Thermodesulfobacteriota bacterium]
MEKLSLDINGIHEYQQNRYPYLLIDVADEVIPGKSASGYKNLTANEWFFPCHFPGDLNMPGALQLEAIVQMSALMVLTMPGHKGKVVYLSTANNIKFSRKVLPGDRFDIMATMTSWKRGIGACSGEGSVNGNLACRADFTIVMPDVLNQYKVLSGKDS